MARNCKRTHILLFSMSCFDKCSRVSTAINTGRHQPRMAKGRVKSEWKSMLLLLEMAMVPVMIAAIVPKNVGRCLLVSCFSPVKLSERADKALIIA